MRRYALKVFYDDIDKTLFGGAKMEQHKHGSWVRYEDILRPQLIHTTLESVVCTCAENVQDDVLLWICPAHGYKKR